jgi:hypothetical protein
MVEDTRVELDENPGTATAAVDAPCAAMGVEMWAAVEGAPNEVGTVVAVDPVRNTAEERMVGFEDTPACRGEKKIGCCCRRKEDLLLDGPYQTTVADGSSFKWGR